MPLSEDDKQWIRGELARVEQKIEQTETNLLTAFHQRASPAEMRARTHSVLRALEIEAEPLAYRITKLEKPPQ
jgi:hypothetical protein